MIPLIAVALGLSAPSPAETGQMTMRDLQTLCGGHDPGEACRFYILGVIEGTGLASGVANDHAHFCMPPGVTQTEIVAVVKRLAAADLARFPEDASMPAVSFIGAALLRTYPCNSN